MSDLSLYVVTHKKINTSDMAPCFVPIQAGGALHENLGYLADNTGDNISNLNKYIDECTALYWIWKNDNSSKYIGINHYRRFFGDDTESNPSKIASSDLLLKYLESYDIITLNPVSFPPLTVSQQFESFMDPDAFERGMSIVPKIIKKSHPEYFADYEQVFSMSEFYHCNMFVTSREIFSKYCEWLFDILIEACHQIDIESYDNYSRRVIGFWAERLLSVWLHHNNYRIKTLPLIEKDLSQVQAVSQKKEEPLEEKKSVLEQKSEKVDAVLTETERLLNSMEQGLLLWYEFKKNSKILYVSDKQNDALVQYMLSLECSVDVKTIAASSHLSQKYDYIIVVGMLERCREPIAMIQRWNSLLAENGVLLLACENRFGIKYFSGDLDPFTKKQFDGIENYRRYGANIVNNIGGRCYGFGELKELLQSSGMENVRFYSVMPDYKNPQLIYAEDYLPNEELANRYFPVYENPNGVFLEEHYLYSGLAKNDLFHQMANAYFIECPKSKNGFSNVNHVTLALNRKKEFSVVTIITRNEKVIKKNAFPEGRQRLLTLKNNIDELKAHGIKVVDINMTEFGAVMDYVSAPNSITYMVNLIREDKEKFIELLDHFRDCIMSSSEVVGQNELGPLLKKCYMDMVPVNAFFKDGDFVFYDQEMYEENYPANVILCRTVYFFYQCDSSIQEIIPIEFFLDRYGIKNILSKLCDLSGEFTGGLVNQSALAGYNALHRGNPNIISANRALMQSRSFESNLFDTCMEDCYDKKVIVFGAGRYADKFIDFYKDEFDIAYVVDNNSAKWGTEIQGKKISSPNDIAALDKSAYKVIICVKNYKDIYAQTLLMGFTNVGVFDINRVYEGRQKHAPKWADDSMKRNFAEHKKPYHIGYIAGVFDLYHIGHLNMFRRAKEQCDYLIAAVVSDEGVRKFKHVEPYVPFEERMAMVQSCQYVDEAVRIPLMYGGTMDAFRKYHFDAQFSGSDYENDPFWLDMKRQLEVYGSTMIFFPYTQQTSSTKLKQAINNAVPVQEPVPPAPKPYKIGYYPSVIPLNDQGVLEHLKNLSNECEKLVVGIPNDVITARIFGDGAWPPAEQIKAQLESQNFVDHVEILGYEELLRQNIFNKVNYDITWYGSEYGFNLDSDKKFMQEKNIEFRSLIPERLGTQCEQDALKIALKNVQPKQKIILWGTGKYFDIYIERYANKYKPAYAIDNNAEKWHTSKNGVQIYPPGILRKEDKENILIVVCVKDWRNVVDFCDATFGHFNYRTMLYNNSIALLDEFGIAASQETKYLSKAQLVLLKMLKEFDRVCRENNIHYYGICGTLIGAVRHHGFIPWDDDVDVAIPRDDYERLKKIAKKVWGKDNGEYLFVDYNELGNNTFLDCMPRLYYMKEHFPTKCFDKAEGKATADVGNRMLIDFYVMDNASNNEKRHMRYMNKMKVVYNFLMAKRAYIDYSEYDRLPKKTLRLMKTVHFIGKCIPFSVLIKWYERLSRYAAKEKCDYYFMPSCAITCIERRFKKTFFEEGQDCKVEDMLLKIPKDVEGIMEAMWYHNYMTPICESRRRPSHYFNSDITIW